MCAKHSPAAALQMQFGSSYGADAHGLRDFKRAFLRELKKVSILPKGQGDMARSRQSAFDDLLQIATKLPWKVSLGLAALSQGSLFPRTRVGGFG